MKDVSKGVKGFNSVREIYNGCNHGRHAEVDAVQKLPSLGKKNNKKIINLIVIRVDYEGKLKNSRPCARCISYLNSISIKKGYKIKNVYYSYDNGVILKEKFTNLLNSDQNHVSRRFRNNRMD